MGHDIRGNYQRGAYWPDVEAATIEPDGIVRISALVEDGLAALKTRERIYPGISIRFDGDEIDEVALVDRDFSKLLKGAGAADTVLVKIYSGGIGKMSKSDEDAKKAVEPLLNRAIVPDASDATKRSQAFSDWQMLYRAGRRRIVGDPRSALHDTLTARLSRAMADDGFVTLVCPPALSSAGLSRVVLLRVLPRSDAPAPLACRRAGAYCTVFLQWRRRICAGSAGAAIEAGRFVRLGGICFEGFRMVLPGLGCRLPGALSIGAPGAAAGFLLVQSG
jgi:hypothetical protein